MNNDALKVHQLLGGLFERRCTATRKRFTKEIRSECVVFGRYVNDTDELVGVVAADAAFVCFTGAAIMMMSPGVASDMRAEGDLPEALCDAFGEVLNVMSRLFNPSGSPHRRYGGAEHGDASQDIADLIKASSSRRSFGFEICGYGEGTVTLFEA